MNENYIKAVTIPTYTKVDGFSDEAAARFKKEITDFKIYNNLNET